MARLTTPSPAVHPSFVRAMAEFEAEGRGGASDHSMIGSDLRSPRWRTREGFAGYVRDLVADAGEDAPRPDGWVPCTTLWWVDGDEYIGRIAIRHRLTPFLLDVGGHIGYDVRAGHRRRGHATAMLAAALPVARRLGIESALITCDEDNVASRLVIERNGGVFEDVRGIKRRYWTPTGS